MQVHESNLTNRGIYERDWAAVDRQEFLREIRFGDRYQRGSVGAGMPVDLCGTDVSGGDSRSVKAYLNGRGDLRAGWWVFYAALYRLATRRGIEHAMCSFHSFHHALSVRRIEFVGRRRQVARDIQTGGIKAALKNYR